MITNNFVIDNKFHNCSKRVLIEVECVVKESKFALKGSEFGVIFVGNRTKRSLLMITPYISKLQIKQITLNKLYHSNSPNGKVELQTFRYSLQNITKPIYFIYHIIYFPKIVFTFINDTN